MGLTSVLAGCRCVHPRAFTIENAFVKDRLLRCENQVVNNRLCNESGLDANKHERIVKVYEQVTQA